MHRAVRHFRKMVEHLDRVSATLKRSPRPAVTGRRIKIYLRRKRLKHRLRPRAESSWAEILCAAAFAAIALGFLARGYAGRTVGYTHVFPLPFAVVALLGIWNSRLATAQRILWSIPAVAFVIPFLPAM